MGNASTVLAEKQPQSVQPHYSGGGVGLAQKEKPPISPRVVPETSIEASEQQPSIDREAIEAGDKLASKTPTLTEDHRAVGIQHAGESMPVDAKKTLGVGQLPTIEEVKENLTQPSSNSGRWWAELGRKILKRFGFWK